MFIPSIQKQRALLGFSTPSPEERTHIWSRMSIPSANLYPETGGYHPHRLIKRLHDGPWRYVAEGGGLRGGKSLGSSAEGTAWLPHSDLIWLAAETYDLTRQEFDYMSEAAQSLGWVDGISKPKNKYQPCAFETPWGCMVETRSLHDLGAAGQGASLVARAPDLIILCEPGFAPAESLQHSRERLTTKRGRLWMAGTFEQANTWFIETWHKWKRWPNADMGKSLAVPSWLNTASFPGGKHDAEIESIKRQYPTLREFLVRWGGVPMASEALVMGAYWDEKKHIDSGAQFQALDQGMKRPVEIAVDPGYASHYAVMAIQRFGDYVVIIDEVATKTMVHEEVIDLCRTKPWWPNVVGGTIDPYAGVNHVYGGPTPQEVWWRYGKVPLKTPIRLDVEESVSRLQFLMRDPSTGKTKLRVNPSAVRLRYEMSHWKRMRTREGLGKPSETNCDAIKALAYYASARYTQEGLAPREADNIKVSDFVISNGQPMGVNIVDRYPRRSERQRPFRS